MITPIQHLNITFLPNLTQSKAKINKSLQRTEETFTEQYFYSKRDPITQIL